MTKRNISNKDLLLGMGVHFALILMSFLPLMAFGRFTTEHQPEKMETSVEQEKAQNEVVLEIMP